MLGTRRRSRHGDQRNVGSAAGTITVMFVAGCLTLVLLPWGAFAASRQLVSITGKGGHKVAVTKSDALKVSDGKGAVTVDGKVGVTGKVGVDRPG